MSRFGVLALQKRMFRSLPVAMDTRTRLSRTAAVAAATLLIAACGGGGEGRNTPAGAAAQGPDTLLTQIDGLLEQSVAIRFMATLFRTDVSYGIDGETIEATYPQADFARFSDVSARTWLQAVRDLQARIESDDWCVIGGVHDGVPIFSGDELDQFPSPESVPADEHLSVTDEAGALGTLVLVSEAFGDWVSHYYDFEYANANRTSAVGDITIDVTGGGNFPGIGGVVLSGDQDPFAIENYDPYSDTIDLESVFRWTPSSGGNSRVYVDYYLMGESSEVEVSCVVRDDGAFSLPAPIRALMPDVEWWDASIDIGRDIVELRLAADVLLVTGRSQFGTAALR